MATFDSRSAFDSSLVRKHFYIKREIAQKLETIIEIQGEEKDSFIEKLIEIQYYALIHIIKNCGIYFDLDLDD